MYSPESVENIAYRVENGAIIAQYPELETMQTQHWNELRSGIFSEENILEIINSNHEKLDASGVLARNFEKLKQNVWGGQDTRKNLKNYIKIKLEVLDEKYGLL